MSDLRYRAYALALACVGVHSGCVPAVTQGKPREPHREVPSSFGSSGGTAGAGASRSGNLGNKSWKEFFADPELEGLIENALANNQELNMQLQEIIIARNEVAAREGEYLPRLGVEAGAGVDKVGEHTSQGVNDEAHNVPAHLQRYRFGLVAAWEVDIWGKLRNAARSAAYRYLASIEGRNFVITELVAELASSYYELLALDRQLEVLKSNIEIQRDALEVVKLQKQAARATQLAVQRFEAEVLKNRSKQYRLEQRIVEAENRINFLVGRYPQPVTRNPQRFNDPVPEIIQAGVPSQLLDNRPDVRQAELQLEASKLDVEVARARFFPSLSIEAGVGYEGFNPKHLLTTPESIFYNLAGNLTAPLLNRQAIEAEYFSANAEQLRAIFNYERTILTAFTEVANQLALVANLRRSYELGSQQVDTLTASIGVSNVLFQSARADYMEVLLTRRDALEAQMELIEMRLQQRHAMVHVYQALGGGWR